MSSQVVQRLYRLNELMSFSILYLVFCRLSILRFGILESCRLLKLLNRCYGDLIKYCDFPYQSKRLQTNHKQSCIHI